MRITVISHGHSDGVIRMMYIRKDRQIPLSLLEMLEHLKLFVVENAGADATKVGIGLVGLYHKVAGLSTGEVAFAGGKSSA